LDAYGKLYDPERGGDLSIAPPFPSRACAAARLASASAKGLGQAMDALGPAREAPDGSEGGHGASKEALVAELAFAFGTWKNWNEWNEFADSAPFPPEGDPVSGAGPPWLGDA
jgi:hypothetical protein